MEKLEQLQLVDVKYDDKTAKLTFLHAERNEIREVKLNKQSYDRANNKYYDDEVREQKMEAIAQEHFGLPFDRLAEAIGERRDIYAYDDYNLLYEAKVFEKFDEGDIGLLTEVIVEDVTDDGQAIYITFNYEGGTYFSRMRYSQFLEGQNKYFNDPILQKKQYARFEKKFHIPVDNKEELIGKKVMIEVKKAFGNVYAEVKPFPKKKN